MALVWRSEAAPRPAPLPAPCSAQYSLVDYSITQVPYELRDLSWTSADGSELGDKKLENEVMVDTWSSMDSSNSPLTDSGPSASDDCTPSTSSDPPRSSLNPFLPKEPDRPKAGQAKIVKPVDKSRARNLTLDLDPLEPESSLPRRPHFLDEDYQPPSKSNLECRIPKPHFLDHIPSPDELDERSDLNNPNFLEDEIDGDEKKTGALAKKPPKPTTPSQERPRTNYRSTLHYGLESAARSSERDKRASQLYNRGTWPGEREWTGQDAASVRSFSSNGSADGQRPSSNIESKMECVYSLLSLLTLSPDNNADLSGSLLEMSRNVDSCIAMRQAGCIPLLVQLIHSKLPRETRDRAAKALRNIIHTQTDDKAGRREARVWRLLEQVREYCYLLEDVVEGNKEDKSGVEDDATKHPSQSVAALMKLSFDEEHRHVVCQLGGLQALAALVSGDQAAHGSRTDDNTCLTMRKYAGMTLTNLTFGDGNNKSLLCSFKDFMMALVEQLESPNEDMRQVTAAVLRNLSWRADTNSKQVLREVGAVKGLTKAAMSCQKEATLKSVLSALWNLTAHCSMNKVALCSVDGALGFLVDMLSYNSPTKTLAIIENAGGIMRNVSSHIAVREDYREILRERNCLSVLLQHLKSPSLTVVSNSCGTLWNLSARCPLDQQFLWDHGAVPMLRSLIHSKHKMIAMGSSAALKNLLNSKPGKTHIISLDSTARSMNLPALPTLNARKQKALEQELDQNLAETCDNIEPATSPSTSNREEKNLFTATMNLERHRMTSSSPLMGTLASQISLSHSANLAGYLSCSNTLLKGVLARSDSSTTKVNRSDSKDSVTSAQSDTAVERVMRTGKVPVPTPRNKDLMKTETTDAKTEPKNFRYPQQPPIPPPRNTEMRTNYTESGYDVDQDSCDQPIDYSTKYSETKTEAVVEAIPKKPSKKSKKEFGDYQETDLDQPTDYSLRYTEHQSETGSDASDPPGPSVDEDTIQHFATEGTPYETPIIFSTATSMSDLRVIGRDGKPKSAPAAKEQPERMARSDEKDSVDRPDNDKAVKPPVPEKRGVFDTKFSSGMISPEKPVNYCEEGTPGYFSRVSSLSSLGEPTEEDCLAKRNAMATIHVDPAEDLDCGGVKDKEGSKAVTFAATSASTPPTPSPPPLTPGTGLTTPGCVQDTPLMFSRTSSLSSLPAGETQDVQSLHSEVSRLTSGCISPSEIPDSPTQSVPASPARAPPSPPPPPAEESAEPRSVFEERATTFLVENTPAHFSTATSLSSLTIDDEHNKMLSEIISEEHAPGDADVSADSARYGERDDRIPGEYRASSTRDLDQPAEGAPGGGSVGSASDLSALSIPDDNYDARLQSLLPGYLRASTETVKMTQEYNRTVRDRAPLSPPPPPLPPKTLGVPRRPPPAPPVDAGGAPPPPLPRAPRRDSLSSLSLDSFGSTDREIFEETVQAGLCSVAPRARDQGRGKAHSVERPAEPVRPHRQHKSLDRSEKITRLPAERRPPRARHDPRPRAHRDGPPGLDLSNSLSSLSNDSFGSTDKEVFERCVRVGMATGPEGRLRARSTDRLEPRDSNRARRRRSEQGRGALDRMVGEDSRDRALLEEVIARGAGERGPPKNVQAPSLGAHEDGSEGHARIDLQTTGYSDTAPQTIGCSDTAPHTTGCSDTAPQVTGYSDTAPHTTGYSDTAPQTTGYSDTDPHTTGCSDTAPQVTGYSDTAPHTTGYSDTAPQTTGYSDTDPHTTGCSDTAPQTTRYSDTAPRTTGYSDTFEATEPDTRGSNECLANRSGNTTLDSAKDELNRSNESYAAVLDGSWSDGDAPADRGTLTRKQHDWTDGTDRRADTWDDNTCPDDVTFPTLSGSYLRSEAVDPAGALPDLVERIDAANRTPSRPDLTHRLGPDRSCNMSCNMSGDKLLDSVPEPSFASLADDGENHFGSIMSAAIEREAARLAAQLRLSQCTMVDSATSLTSLDLDNVKPPSHLGSLLSLSTSGHWEESSQMSKKSKGRKKSIPVTMVKRALSNSMHQGSSEHLDSSPVSFLDNVKPPAEMEHIDMEGSMISVSSIASEVAEGKEKPALVFDFKQPVHDFPICNALSTVYHDLDKVNPPSLFDEMVESTLEIDQTTAQEVFDDCLSTLNVVTDIPSGSENCTPIPSDVSSVESTPKRRNAKYLTPKEKRQIARDRFQTYTIADTLTENASVLEDDSEYLTWTKSESDSRSDDYATAASEPKSKRKSAKQRRIDDRARYLTQTVDLNTILQNGAEKTVDPQIESLRQRLAAKRTVKQKRQEDADRFRTRTLSDDIPPSPTFICKDINFETVESTTGYDSLSSNEPNHQQLLDDRHSDACSRDADSGNNEDDFELNSTKMQTYTRSFRHYLPVTESPAAVDMCVAKNLKNIEMTASYRRLQDGKHHPSSGDFASYEGESNSEEKAQTDSEPDTPPCRPKPKITKPGPGTRDESLDSDSQEKDEVFKAVRGRKKALYVSPYRRSVPSAKQSISPVIKPAPKALVPTPNKFAVKTPNRTPSTSKTSSATTSPKKLQKPATKLQKTPLSAIRPLPLERQGTFTKEESSVPPKDLPVLGKTPGRAAPPAPLASTSPSRLPQPGRFTRPPLRKVSSTESKLLPKKTGTVRSAPAMRSSASNQSLQSNDSGKTVTLAARSRPGSSSSVSSTPPAKLHTKDIESKIAGLWKKVEQNKKVPTKPDRRVWIEPEEPPRLLRSNTFEGKPQEQVAVAPKQKTSIGLRVTQIPSLKSKTNVTAKPSQLPSKRPANAKVFAKKPVYGQT